MKRALLALAVFALPAFADCNAVTAQIAELDGTVSKLRHDFAAQDGIDLLRPEWAASYLTMLVAVDQAVREAAMTWPALHNYDDAETLCFWTLLTPRWEQIDEAGTDGLSSLMALHHWITVPKFGAQAADDAWLLAQHADRRRDFQREVLAILAELWPRGEVPAKHYAYLEDRVHTYGDRVPQRFGTQGACRAKGDWQPSPIAEPRGQLDQRRQSMGLVPFAEQKARLDAICL